MTVYAKKVQSSNPRFQGREIVVGSANYGESRIPIPDSVVLCNGCNQNIEEGYLVYLGKRELKADQPYDYYCPDCLKGFKGAVIVED